MLPARTQRGKDQATPHRLLNQLPADQCSRADQADSAPPNSVLAHLYIILLRVCRRRRMQTASDLCQ